jgi:hypothetical protein
VYFRTIGETVEVRQLAIAMLVIAVVHVAFGQGGPPMITDDPGTPGNGKWENNLAIIFEHRPNESSLDVPEIDLNYGVGEHFQLTLQAAPVINKRGNHGLIGGIGGTEAAVKWRFLDEAATGVALSIFPRVIFNVSQASVRRGLAEDGTRFQIPFEIAKGFGPWHGDAEFGPRAGTVGRSEWFGGIVCGLDFSKRTMLMAELHDESRMDFRRNVFVLNFGLRYEWTANEVLIVSMGHELRSPDQPTALIGYFGMQFVY